MKKRIFVNMILLTLSCLVVISTILSFIFYIQISGNVRNEIKARAEVFTGFRAQEIQSELASFKPSDVRITLINPDGTVAYDNTANATKMENHKDRTEVQAAFESGFGEGKRFSDTLGKETYYYAIRLADDSILRVAKTTSSIFGMFMGAFPAIILAVILVGIICYLAAGRLTKRIIAPLGSVNLNGDLSIPYDELAPFVRTIENQREHIAQQIFDLQNRKDTISAIMDNMNEGIILTNKQGIILSANKSVLRIFDKNPPVDGINILGFFRDVTFSEHVRAALLGNSGEMSLERAGRVYRIYFSHVSDGGAIILFLDITEKAKSEKLRREFSANVSHELKTPLTTIYGHAEMLYNDIAKDDDKQAFYGKIKDEAKRMIALIEDILMISKLDEGGGQALFEDVELVNVATEAVQSLSYKATENNITIQVIGEHVWMKANRTLMYELFYNLIDNAIKYNTPDGTVTVNILNTKNQVNIIVSDTGIGIPKEAQSRVFERFYRVDKSRSKKTGGTGLGLAIVKHIVMVHNGTIDLESRENEGTTVIIFF